MNHHESAELEAGIDQALAILDLKRAEALAERYLSAASAAPRNDNPALTPIIRAHYLAGRVALAAGQLELAQRRLDPVMEQVEKLEVSLAWPVWLMAGEVQARQGLQDEARTSLAHLRRLPVTPFQEPRLWLRELRIRLWLGEVATLTDEIATCARALTDDSVNRTLLLVEEGCAWEAAGDMTQAETCWRRAASLSQSGDCCATRAYVQIQLGRLAHLRGHLQSALDHYGAALEATPLTSPQLLEIRLRRLLVDLELNQEERARAQYAELLGGARMEQLPEEIRGLATNVHILLGNEIPGPGSVELQAYRAVREGDRQLAQELYLRAFRRESSPVRRARLALALGLLALAVTTPDRLEVERWLSLAEDLAGNERLPEVLWRALEGRGQAAGELARDDARARRFFEEAVLVSEEQVRALKHAADAAIYHLRRANLVRLLTRGACRRGDAAAVFHYQELERGRLLLGLWHSAGRRLDYREGTRELENLDRQLQDCEALLLARQKRRKELKKILVERDDLLRRLLDMPGPSGNAGRADLARLQAQVQNLEAHLGAEEQATPTADLLRRHDTLLLQQDRALEAFLADRSRGDNAALPRLPTLEELARVLPPGTVYVAPSLVEDELYLLVVRRGATGQVVRAKGSVALLRRQVADFWARVRMLLDRYDQQLPLGPPERAALDRHLEDLGQGSLGTALDQVLLPGERLLWVADDALHGLPIAALRLHGQYLIERHEVVFTFSGALTAHQQGARYAGRQWGPGMVVTEAADELPSAGLEGEGVLAALWRGRWLTGTQATRAALRPLLARARAAHFACHAEFDAERPLAARLKLPSGESWNAALWLDEPVAGLPLLTLSACCSAEVTALVGREVFGLVTAVLAGGVRAVVAGLWLVPDREATLFMWRFYRYRLTGDLATALAKAQRDGIADADGSPLYWAVFALFGDALALPAPPWWLRWWARWRQRRHQRRFATLPENLDSPHQPRASRPGNLPQG